MALVQSKCTLETTYSTHSKHADDRSISSTSAVHITNLQREHLCVGAYVPHHGLPRRRGGCTRGRHANNAGGRRVKAAAGCALPCLQGAAAQSQPVPQLDLRAVGLVESVV